MHRIVILSLFAVCLIIGDALAQANKDYEHVVVFTTDGVAWGADIDTVHYAWRHRVDFVCGPEPTTVTLTSRAVPGYFKQIQLDADELFEYEIWKDTRLTQDVSQEVPSDWALFVTSSAPVSCYSTPYRDYEGVQDGLLIPSRRVCANEYLVLSYYSDTILADKYKDRPGNVAEYFVSAFEDNTEIAVVHASSTLSGRQAGDTLRIVLNRGQVFRVYQRPELGNDATGTTISSTKPVAVQVMHGGTDIPSMVYRWPNSQIGWPTTLGDAVPPISLWGYSYFAIDEDLDTLGYLIRVLASEEATHVLLNGSVWGSPLARGEFRDTLVFGKTLITGSKRILAAQFPHTPGEGISSGFAAQMTVLASIDHPSNDLSFYAYRDEVNNYRNHYVTIVTRRSSKDKISLVGNPISTSEFYDIPYLAGETELSAATIKVSEGAHRVTSGGPADEGFVLTVTGHGSTNSVIHYHAYGYAVAGYHTMGKSAVEMPEGRLLELNVYPNPTQDKVTIEWEARVVGVVNLEVYSVAGVLVHEEEISGSTKPITLDTRSWPSGAYSIVLRRGDEEARGSVIKQ